MEQLQNLVTQYALGIRRVELEEEQEKPILPTAIDTSDLVHKQKDVKVRGRRILLRLQHAANRSIWISSTECALFVHTEQQHWASHNEVPMFLSRALYQISECKRILSGCKTIITRADTSVHLSVLNYECTDTQQFAELGDVVPLAEIPASLHNVGNTCFMNSLLQCCRRLITRISPELLPKSQCCPLAVHLRQRTFTEEDVAHWECWNYLTIGTQRDACQIMEMCLDTTGPMHTSCYHGDCYGALLRDMTSFEVVRETLCDHCDYSSEESQIQCILRVEPAHSEAEASIGVALQTAPLEDFKCQVCHGKGGRQEIRLCDLPQFLIVHFNKYADASGPSMDALVHIAGIAMQRVAVTHHTGRTPDSGHYTATVATPDGRIYDCNDATIFRQPESCDKLWQNSYLSFLHNGEARESASTSAGGCPDGIHVTNNIVSSKSDYAPPGLRNSASTNKLNVKQFTIGVLFQRLKMIYSLFHKIRIQNSRSFYARFGFYATSYQYGNTSWHHTRIS